ncbi:hypothetical protein HKCCSP123_05460 [Rhodobacterales bacterium HKCCSP123]|nr:hypothetical protein [Rhodobacterales bacterium HKCCSP123]
MIRTAALLACLAASASAEPWDCVFTVECLAAGDCEGSALEVQVIAADHAGDLFLSTVTGASPVARLTGTGALPATYASAGRDGLAELLTIEGDHTAILTVHLFDGAAAAITYFGTCEEMT